MSTLNQRFNPSKVRLKLSFSTHRKVRGWCFNPSKVRLKPVPDLSQRTFNNRFNPSKVRLKPVEGQVVDVVALASIPQRFV